MRTLSVMVAALSLGACATQPPTLSDIVTQIRSDFGAGRQSCADRSTSGPGHNLTQAKCFTGNPVAQSKQSVQMAEPRPKQRIVNDHAPGFNTPGPAVQPTLASANETVVEGVPTLNSDASCYLADNLAVDQNVNRCLAVESSARDPLDRKWIVFPRADRSHCIRYSSASGGYADLLTCLEMDLYARNLHAKSRSVANQ
jgi:hypothetical protein